VRTAAAARGGEETGGGVTWREERRADQHWCGSQSHYWLDPEDARKCCNPAYVRVIDPAHYMRTGRWNHHWEPVKAAGAR
jgi:hypothetical protein